MTGATGAEPEPLPEPEPFDPELDDIQEPIIVVFGGQFGSEGKGEIVAHLAQHTELDLSVVRTGGPNAGHTVTLPDGRRIKMRHVPAAWVNPKANLYLSSGGLIDPHVLKEELESLERDFGWDGLFIIDRMAMVIKEEHREWERENGMRGRIGSTTEGIGAARVDKIRRTATLLRDEDNIVEFDAQRGIRVMDTIGQLNGLVNSFGEPGKLTGHLLIESTQGFGLSLETSGFYPYATSANITPAHLLGEVGLSPHHPHFNIAVMRTYPIRVAGNSGPLANEITWEELEARAPGRSPTGGEKTTVTQLVRRIGEWDSALASRMAMVCKPDAIALTFLDYVFPELGDVTDPEVIMAYEGVRDYIKRIEAEVEAPVLWIGTGPGKVSCVWGMLD